ncbi:MAG: DPP IV N-terminal domain-containing protein [Ginsengibacter sp.]
MRRQFKNSLFIIIFLLGYFPVFSQFKAKEINWTSDGKAYLEIREGNIVRNELPGNKRTVLVTEKQLTPKGTNAPLNFSIYEFSPDYKTLLIFTNTAKVWRYNTRGDYWILDIPSGKLIQLGKGLPSQSLMYAKISPDGKKAAYVSQHNIFMEDLSTNKITQLTTTGTRKMINGTFDWVYEEEFGCRDGFRWSPDSRRIAFWEVDARQVRDYYMLNTTDSVYSQIIPVEYPKVGEPPSPVRIGIITVENKQINWMKVPGNPQQHYIPRMEWANNSSEIVLQQLNRKQNESKLFYCDVTTGAANLFYTEKDDAFIDVKSRWNRDDPMGWDWINDGKEFLWVSEKDGWRSIYTISREGKRETLVTKGKFDITSINSVDEEKKEVYFMASPDHPAQLYLFKTSLSGKGPIEALSPASLKGTHYYNISPGAKYAYHTFSNYKTMPAREWISMSTLKPLDEKNSILKNLRVNENSDVSYFKVTTEDNITVDGWMKKPVNFDSTKKYPVVFYVYGEPASSTISDKYGIHENSLFAGDMSLEGYFQISVDNRGTPYLRGREWRKSIYGKLGRINIRDQAMAAKKILEKPWFDKDRVAVWGWSGGGSSTMNLMFQYPEIYKTGISIAAVTNLLFYDNIYEERYMGLPEENMDGYIKGSPVYYAKNLQGNLLFIHGTGDDNVHYDNAELMLNELIKHNKQFEFMAYPNRSHSVSEGEGTAKHLSTLYSNYLRKHCPPGPRNRK